MRLTGSYTLTYNSELLGNLLITADVCLLIVNFSSIFSLDLNSSFGFKSSFLLSYFSILFKYWFNKSMFVLLGAVNTFLAVVVVVFFYFIFNLKQFA